MALLSLSHVSRHRLISLLSSHASPHCLTSLLSPTLNKWQPSPLSVSSLSLSSLGRWAVIIPKSTYLKMVVVVVEDRAAAAAAGW